MSKLWLIMIKTNLSLSKLITYRPMSLDVYRLGNQLCLLPFGFPQIYLNLHEMLPNSASGSLSNGVVFVFYLNAMPTQQIHN